MARSAPHFQFRQCADESPLAVFDQEDEATATTIGAIQISDILESDEVGAQPLRSQSTPARFYMIDHAGKHVPITVVDLDDIPGPVRAIATAAELKSSLRLQRDLRRDRGLRLHVSKIYNVAALRRFAPMKDVVVPSGPNAGILPSIFNLVNSTLGPGVLTIPQAMHDTGILLSTFIALLLGLASTLSARMMLQAGAVVDAVTYDTLAERLFGIWGSRAVDALTIVYGFGTMVASNVLICDFMQPVMVAAAGSSESVLTNRVLILALLHCAIIVPLSVRRNINSLRVVSLLSAGLIVFYLVVLFWFASVILPLHGVADVRIYAHVDMTLFSALPLWCYAYVNHVNVFPIFAEMKDPTIRNMTIVSTGSQIFCGACYYLAGIVGYLIVGPGVSGNLLNNVPQQSYIMHAVRTAFALNMAFSYPLFNFSVRLSAEHVYEGIRSSKLPTAGYYAVTTFLIGSAFGVALVIANVSTVFTFTGAIGACSLMLILPGLCYARTMSGYKRVGGVCFAVLGSLMLVMGIVSAALSI